MCKDSNIRVVVSKGGMRTCEVVPPDTPIDEVIRLFLCCLGLVFSPVEIHCAMREVAKGYRDERDGEIEVVNLGPWKDLTLIWDYGDTNTEGEDD